MAAYRNIDEANRRISELETRLAENSRELRLMKLRRQPTPHFLFNSLAVAASLIMQSPATAVKFLGHLSRIYRYLLEYGAGYWVPVEKEMDLMRQYYALMCYRYVDCLRLEVSPRAARLRSNPLPPLCLQGLMENAIKHNVHTEDRPLRITVDSDGKFIWVSNPVAPTGTEENTTHRGLAYMDESMRLLFGRGIEVDDAGGTFTVRIPLIDPSAVEGKKTFLP